MITVLLEKCSSFQSACDIKQWSVVIPCKILCPVEKCHISAISVIPVSFFQQRQLPAQFVCPRPYSSKEPHKLLLFFLFVVVDDDYYSTNTTRDYSDNGMFTVSTRLLRLPVRRYRQYKKINNNKKSKNQIKSVPTLSQPVQSILPRPNVTMCLRVLSHLFLSQFQYVYAPLTFDLDLVSS